MRIMVGVKFLTRISEFLKEELRLELHPDKISIKTLASGVDFLGWVNFSDHRILRTKTKKRMLKKIKNKNFLLREDLISEEKFSQSLQSYLGMLTHCAGYRIRSRIEDIVQNGL